MSVPAAYFALVLIWATTPLALKWSGEGPGFLFAVMARIVLSAGLALAVLAVTRGPFPWNRAALRAYAVAGGSLYLGMMSGYWGAQFIPSGLISIIFGLAPIGTGILAAWWLGEHALSARKLLGMGTGIAGLAVIFIGGIVLGTHALYGIGAWLFATAIHSATTVSLKRWAHAVPALAITVASLTIASLLDAVTWLWSGAHWPQHVALKAQMAILYLSVFGSLFGYLLYYYALKRLRASQMALITLITPALAVTLGHIVNGERLTLALGIGAALILSGLLLHQWDEFRLRARATVPRGEFTSGVE